jgi:DNA-binding transcriptional regulator LsrR (DeoR family)
MNTFADRLSALLDQRGISQSQLAGRLAVSRSTITGWLRYGKLPDADLIARLCRELACPSDWLLGIASPIERQNPSGKIRWLEQTPPGATSAQTEQLAYGIRLFNLFMTENRSAAEVRRAHNAQYIRAALQAALRSGAIRLLSVARSTDLETALRGRYPRLKEVVVADTPENYDDTLLRTELVAFLAAREVLSGVIRQSAVGLGPGYTLLRLCEHSTPSIDQFSGTRWVPLVAFQPQNTDAYSANYLARLMSLRHPGSRALYLPHPDECAAEAMKAVHAETTRAMHNMQTLFVSVSGVDRRDRSGHSHFFAEFRSADYEVEAASLRGEYAGLEAKDEFGGELLRYLLDRRGQVIGCDPSAGSQVSLDILRYNSEMIGKVCVVAGGAYKAGAARTCVENGLANALVVDSEIATKLLAQR